MTCTYREPTLVWLLVASYAAHLVEEYVGGFPEWFALIRGSPLPLEAFLAINAVGLVAMVAAAGAAGREGRGWLAIAIATILLVNGVAHLLGSLVTATYSPGLLTGLVLYLPLGQFALVRAWHQAPPPCFWRGLTAGVAAHTLVAMTALAVT